VLRGRSQRGPLTVQRPFYPEGDCCHVYVLHPPGGVVGGDRLTVRAATAPLSSALLTMPGAMKVYRSGGRVSTIDQDLVAGPRSQLEWLPQETIVFPGARARMRTRVRLSPSARFLGWEIQCLGRPASALRFDHGDWRSRLELWFKDRPLLIEHLRAGRPEVLDHPAGLRGFSVTATLAGYPADATMVQALRAVLDGGEEPPDRCPVGVSRFDGVVVVRVLGDEAGAVQRLLRRAWSVLRPLLMERPPCPPRIWST
jgi:urease accessory protein